MKLAIVETTGGAMQVSLEDRGGRRLLVGERDGREYVFWCQPAEGFRGGNVGTLDAIGLLSREYSDPSCGLRLLIDWRDLAAEDAEAAFAAHRIDRQIQSGQLSRLLVELAPIQARGLAAFDSSTGPGEELLRTLGLYELLTPMVHGIVAHRVQAGQDESEAA